MPSSSTRWSLSGLPVTPFTGGSNGSTRAHISSVNTGDLVMNQGHVRTRQIIGDTP